MSCTGEKVIENWKTFAEAINAIGGDVQALSISKPACPKNIQHVEGEIGGFLPASFKDVLLNFSSKVEFRWVLPKSSQFQGELEQIFSGECYWSLEQMIELNKSKSRWVEECFSDAKDPYDAIWHETLVFHEVGNGDYLAIDLKAPNRQPVVYLSHDDGDGHGVELAENFQEFVFTTSRIGCVGAEDWQMLWV